MKMVHEIANWFWRYSNVSDDFILNIDFNKRYNLGQLQITFFQYRKKVQSKKYQS